MDPEYNFEDADVVGIVEDALKQVIVKASMDEPEEIECEPWEE